MDGCPETLYLIDGHAQIFRAFYAIRGGLNSPVTGEPTQAVFGFAGMLIKLYNLFKPHYVVVAMDAPGKTFRDELYGDYKANRQAPPTDLHAQIPRIVEVTRLFGIPIFEVPGAEADDLIATITRKVLDDDRCRDVNIRIVSKDKDLQQLLSDRVTMFDIHTDTTIDTEWLKKNKCITPAQVVDLLTLTGDTVDNVPGVEGIGPKTASALIQEYGSIEGIYANLDKITGKKKENLEAARETLKLSRQLVRLKDDVPIDFDLSKARVSSIDLPALRHVFTELGFRKHQTDLEALCQQQPSLDGTGETAARLAAEARREPETTAITVEVQRGISSGGGGGDDEGFAGGLFDALEPATTTATVLLEVVKPAPAGISTAAQFEYRGVYTQEELEELVATLRHQKLVSIDTETVELGHSARMCGFSLAWEVGKGVYVPLLSPTPERHMSIEQALPIIKPILEDPGVAKCGHNLKYDALVLRYAGVELSGIAFDSMIASHLVGSPAHNLDHLSLTLLKHQTIPIESLIGVAAGRGKVQRTMDQVPVEQIVTYAAEDADMALRLYHHFAPQLKILGMDKLAAEVEMPLVEVLADMEFNGIRVEPGVLVEQQKEMGVRIAELREQVIKQAGCDFNPDSPKQLAEVLFKKLGLPVVKKTKTGPSTDIEVLEKLAEMDGLPPEKTAVPKTIVEYRQLTKLVGTYLEGLREAINPRTQRVHSSFHQALTATGRLSSTNPNLQNIPIRTDIGKQIRRAFVAEPEHLLISADYSQIELRILAHLSQDKELLEAFEKDLDVHTSVAAGVFNTPLDQVTKQQRNYAKIINFGIVYGVSAYGLVRRIEGLEIEAAKKLITDYKARYTGIDRFLQFCVQQAMEKGYVETMMGRRRMIPEIHSPNGSQRSLGQRLAINSVVQGSAAELIKLAMVNLGRRIKRDSLNAKLLLQIHDELVLESPAGEAQAHAAIVKEEMERAMTLRVPLKVEVGIGPDWFQTK